MDWGLYAEASRVVHAGFSIPATSYTPVMTRFLFGVGGALKPRRIAVAGSYVGYGTAWLALGSAMHGEGGVEVQGYDVDSRANEAAASNFATLGDEVRAVFRTADARSIASKEQFDLLLIDVDDPADGKALYQELALLSVPLLRPSGVLVAHDARVARFAADIEAYDAAVRRTGRFRGPFTFPIDEFGVSVAIRMTP